MLLSCVPVSYFAEIRNGALSFGELARTLRDVGLRHVDLSVALLRSRSGRYLQSIKRAFAEEGISVSCLVTYSDFLKHDSHDRETEISSFGKDVEVAAALGAEFIRITAGPEKAEITQADGIEWVVEGILKSEQYGRSLGVTILYENHAKPSVWDVPDFSLRTEVFLSVCARLRETGVRILFDTANPLVFGADPCPVLCAVIDRVAFVHLSDIKSRGQQEPVVLGKGIVPFDKILTLLKSAGYQGPISVEEASRTGRRGLEQAIAFARELIGKYGYYVS